VPPRQSVFYIDFSNKPELIVDDFVINNQ